MMKRPFASLLVLSMAAGPFGSAMAKTYTASDLMRIAASTDPDRQKVCLNGRPYTGCCSYHGGIKWISVSGLTVTCADGVESASCSTHLRGCCSDKGGVADIEDDGTVLCGDGERSPSCRCESRAQ